MARYSKGSPKMSSARSVAARKAQKRTGSKNPTPRKTVITAAKLNAAKRKADAAKRAYDKMLRMKKKK